MTTWTLKDTTSNGTTFEFYIRHVQFEEFSWVLTKDNYCGTTDNNKRLHGKTKTLRGAIGCLTKAFTKMTGISMPNLAAKLQYEN
jgi:hypothetical protein